MLFSDTYFTIKTRSEGLFKDRGSKFIAVALPLNTETELKSNLLNVKTEYAKAGHYCWAMRLGPDRSVHRFNDDGEPSGTAGRPILKLLLSKDLTNLQVIVVRYFGGTLLGVPGLINAYKSAATEAIKNAEVIERTLCDVYQINFSYTSMNEVLSLIKENGIQILKQEFGLENTVEIAVRKTELNRIIASLQRIDNTKISFLYAF